MHETLWFLIVGAVLVFMGIAATALRQLPCSAAMFYLAIGYALGPPGVGLLHIDITADAHLLRVITEIALLVSLFAIGLRLRLRILDKLWTVPLRLGFLAMLATVLLLTLFCVYGLQLGWGPSLLLAAILAPTDPVLAHDVQVHSPGDHDLVRFALSGEGGLNDGIALPFVTLALAVCMPAAAQSGGALNWQIAPRAAWGVAGALAIGGALGWATTHAVAWLRTRHAQALGLEGFFALGLIELAYGAAQFAQTYGFLAVFAAGVAMRRVEHRASGGVSPRKAIGTVDSEDVDATAANPSKAHAYMTESVLGFTIELERIAELVVMAMIGNVLANLQMRLFTGQTVALTLVLFALARPVSVELSLLNSAATQTQRRLMSWFGIRGAGSFYYLTYALEQGTTRDLTPLVPLTLAVVAASVVIHGISATPLMNWYHRLRGRAS
ncbi:cation transporter [Paraburkholderia ginsengiterrae]|uniref:Cation transporter n=1 Tax=Paraburkholderia ginsengiterrae TaxID=1462993 RepID=A0A1A9N1N7_9BURK|nr:cation:proton antiporter [Paraburkholderia ginsengiterrae]OAJ53063.1 cation transporter [Paraburkholderia ginsengiterrae]OAJ55760.1 cation transporter [Paraburkholderia ginsengiterrae]